MMHPKGSLHERSQVDNDTKHSDGNNHSMNNNTNEDQPKHTRNDETGGSHIMGTPEW